MFTIPSFWSIFEANIKTSSHCYDHRIAGSLEHPGICGLEVSRGLPNRGWLWKIPYELWWFGACPMTKQKPPWYFGCIWSYFDPPLDASASAVWPRGPQPGSEKRLENQQRSLWFWSSIPQIGKAKPEAMVSPNNYCVGSSRISIEPIQRWNLRCFLLTSTKGRPRRVCLAFEVVTSSPVSFIGKQIWFAGKSSIYGWFPRL